MSRQTDREQIIELERLVGELRRDLDKAEAARDAVVAALSECFALKHSGLALNGMLYKLAEIEAALDAHAPGWRSQ